LCTQYHVQRYLEMGASRRRFVPYRRSLKDPSQTLRRDPTPAERKLWFEFLRDLPLKFTRQKPLGHYIADFYCATRLLVIEVDGDSHFTDRGASYDQARTMALNREGLRVIRFTNADVVERFEGVCTEILQALKKN
jgi:very-short-patch-repair endonuclease